MKSTVKALVLAFVVLCSGLIATASTLKGAIHGSSFAAAGSATIDPVVSPSYAQRIGSFVVLSGSQASNFNHHLSVSDRALRSGELVLGLFGYNRAFSPADHKGLRAFLDASSTAAIRSAAASVRSFAASLPDSSEPNILLFLGISLLGSSLLVLRRRRTASA